MVDGSGTVTVRVSKRPMTELLGVATRRPMPVIWLEERFDPRTLPRDMAVPGVRVKERQSAAAVENERVWVTLEVVALANAAWEL
jgi:hypothetical protein